MSKLRLTRFKKIVLCLSVVISLCFTNLALFSVRASAANVLPSNTSLRTAGAPININFFNSTVVGDYFTGSIPNANVFAWNDSSGNYAWYGSLYDAPNGDTTEIFRFYYPSQISGSEVQIFNQNTGSGVNISTFEFSLASPIIFSSLPDLRSNFDFLIEFGDIYDNVGSPLSTVYATYSFTFLEGGDYLDTYTHSGGSWIPTSGSGTTRTLQQRFFNYIYFGFTEGMLSGIDTFVGRNDNVDYYVLLSATVSFDCYSTSVNIQQGTDSVTYFNSYQSLMNNRFSEVYSGDLYSSNVSFETVDWTSWLVNAVSGFMNFELVPGLTFTGILGLLIGMSLFMIFLKVFAGG